MSIIRNSNTIDNNKLNCFLENKTIMQSVVRDLSDNKINNKLLIVERVFNKLLFISFTEKMKFYLRVAEIFFLLFH